MISAVIKWFFLILGIIFFFLILGGVYLYMADPYEVRPLISALMSNEAPAPRSDGEVSEANSNPHISETQQQALESVGINVEALPSTITPEMEACFVEALGEERTQEIAEGDSPTPVEVFQARHCIE